MLPGLRRVVSAGARQHRGLDRRAAGDLRGGPTLARARNDIVLRIQAEVRSLLESYQALRDAAGLDSIRDVPALLLDNQRLADVVSRDVELQDGRLKFSDQIIILR